VQIQKRKLSKRGTGGLKMTIDEAIAHAMEVAEGLEKRPTLTELSKHIYLSHEN
jgi:hypothetical protein